MSTAPHPPQPGPRLDPRRGQRLRHRAHLVRGIRAFLDALDFTEIEAPVAVGSPGLEPQLDAFELARPAGPRRYLHTSPEYALKRLLGTTDLRRIYSLGPCFRDEPPSRTHAPEFTLLEWYCDHIDLFGLMDQTEALVRAAATAVHGRAIAAAPGTRHTGTQPTAETDLSAPFARHTVRDAFAQHTGVDAWLHPQADALRDALRRAGVSIHTDSPDWDDVFFQAFLNQVEPALHRAGPTFLWGFPASQAALARLDPTDASRALRFELYAGGFELANAFDELTDPGEQRQRFQADLALRAHLGRQQPPIDERLLAALPHLAPTCGIALGIDRLALWLLGAQDITEVRAQPWDEA